MRELFRRENNPKQQVYKMYLQNAFSVQLKLTLDLATQGGCKAELTWLAWLHVLTKTVTHPSTNRAQRRVTSLLRRTRQPLRQTIVQCCRWL